MTELGRRAKMSLGKTARVRAPTDRRRRRIYQYRASILEVLDGDTVRAVVDYGFDQQGKYTLRLADINAPEMGTPEGVAARDHLTELLGLGYIGRFAPPVVITTLKDRREKYGRYLCYITAPDGVRVNDRMVEDGHAVSYL